MTVFEKMGQLRESPVWAMIASTAQTAHVDYYTYIESTRGVRKPRATRCLRENATILVQMLCGGVC